MNLTSTLLPPAWYWLSLLVSGGLLAWSAYSAPWARLRQNSFSHAWLGSIVALFALWQIRAGIEPGLGFHLLGASASTLMFGPQLPALDPYNFMAQYLPDEPKNQSHVNDGVLTDLLSNSSRTTDDKKRRQMVHEFQRHAAKGVYYLRINSQIYQAALDPALQNFGPNLGYDYGGRLMAAWWNK